MLHEPAAKSGKDPASPYKTRLGVKMFFVFAAIYAVFVGLNVADPLAMECVIFAGLNLAVVYGFGLIILAIIMALVYEKMCSKQEDLLADTDNEESN
jgi:uncharacterized membrane protein (DUF485 family)